MSLGQKILSILYGVLMLALSVLLILRPEEGFTAVAAILSLSLTVWGVRYLVYYLTMARHMVGGKLLLFVSIIVLDLGAFTAALSDTPRLYIIIYLLAVHAFSGVIGILRAVEAKRGGAPWRLQTLRGAVGVLFAAGCVVFLRRTEVLVWLYAAGLAWSALTQIADALRNTEIIYIA